MIIRKVQVPWSTPYKLESFWRDKGYTTKSRKVEGAWSDATSIRQSNLVMLFAQYYHLSQTSEVFERDWQFLYHICTISTTFSSLIKELSLFSSLPMHFIIAFMSITARIWACVAICARTVAKFTWSVAIFQNQWPFSVKVWPFSL